MTSLTPELIGKAKTAKSAEELLELAKADGEEITPEEAAAYFNQLNPKSGELDDDDLDNVAGGACGYADDGRKIVDPKCRCQTSFSCKNGCGKDVNYGTGKCNVCGTDWLCQNCIYASKEGKKLYCNNPNMSK